MVSFFFRLAEKEGVAMPEIGFTVAQLRKVKSESLRLLLLSCAGKDNCSPALSRLGELWTSIVAFALSLSRGGCDVAETEESNTGCIKMLSNSGKRFHGGCDGTATEETK